MRYNSSKKSPTEANTRQLTICGKSFIREHVNGGYAYFPFINLCGKWLQDTGFKIGHVVDIAHEDGKLTITIAKEQRFEGL